MNPFIENLFLAVLNQVGRRFIRQLIRKLLANAEELARSTDTEIDDKLLQLVKEALNDLGHDEPNG